MKVLFYSPGFPREMSLFAAGLAQTGVEVIGVGDQPRQMLPERVRRALSAYLQVGSLWDVDQVLAALRRLPSAIDRVECLWEPGIVPAAQVREALGLPGMTVRESVPFRDKERMKQVLDAAGLRTPRHAKATSIDQCRAAAEQIGYPLIVKPIAGAGSADTYRVDEPEGMEEVLPRLRHVSEVSVEEFIEGEEYTFDTVCADGQILFYNVSWYRPRPLIARSVEWISPQTVTLRNPDRPDLAPGLELGRQVLQALGFRTGFTHMEWFLTAEGEAVFGEIGCRPPGARSVDTMNYSCDIDLYRGWAEAACLKRFSQPVERRYNSAIIFKRAQGQGRIRHIQGLERFMAECGPHVADLDLLPLGAPRRNWRQTLLSDGSIIVRHPDLQTTLAIADRAGTDLQIYAE